MSKHPIYNVHTHIFNFDCVPDGFLSNYLPRFVAKLLAPLLRIPLAASMIRRLSSTMMKKYATFLLVGTKRTPLEVYEELIRSYEGEDARFIVLPMNFDYMGGGVAPAPNTTQLELIARVRAQYPDRCLPFLSVDPRQGSGSEILEYVKKYIGPPSNTFVGIKIYPSLGFYPSDSRLERVYEFAEKNQIPIQTHCTRYGAFYAGKKVPAESLRYAPFHASEEVTKRHLTKMYTDATKKKPSDACDVFLDPVNYIDILEKFPELKICLAHFGGEEEMVMVFDDKGNRKQQQDVLTNADFLVNNGLPDSTSWFRIVEYLLLHPRYKNVYTDVSFTLHENKLYKALGKLILSSPYKERILFGTDYFMTTQYKSEFNLYDEFRTAVDNKDIWRRVSFENPVSYLKSAFYTPPLDSALSTFNQ